MNKQKSMDIICRLTKLENEALILENEKLKEDLIELRKAKDRDALVNIDSDDFKGTKIGDLAKGEALYFFPSYHKKHDKCEIICQSVAIAPTDGMVSFIFSKMFSNNVPSSYTQFWFTREEVMLLIKGLAESIAMIERGEE